MLEEMLERFAVRIETVSGDGIGSGILWMPQNESEFVYIFTAAHVVYGVDIAIRLLNSTTNNEVLFEKLSICDIKCHDKFIRENDLKENDVAVIRIKREDWMSASLPNIILGVARRHLGIIGRGFPNGARDDSFRLSGQELKGIIGNNSTEKSRFQIQLAMSLNAADRDTELRGYSGSGIFHESRSNDELVLMGIFSYGQGIDAAQGVTNAFSVNLIKEICENQNWDIPEYETDAPKSFEPYIEKAISKIENKNVKIEILENIQDIVDNHITPCSLNDCYDVPICKRIRLRCDYYWIAKLQLLGIIRIMGVTNDKLQNPSIVIDYDGENLTVPIEFLCSEGSDGSCTSESFIRSLVLYEYVWKERMSDNGIIIWASDEIPSRKTIRQSKITNIVRSICYERGGESKKRGLHIKYGESAPNNLSVIHIHKIIEELDLIDKENCTLDDMKECLKELFVDAISG